MAVLWRVCSAILLLSGLFAWSGEMSPIPWKTAYDFQHFTTEHGLPQETVQCLAQTPDGALWIGSLRGLSRFNGLAFDTYDNRREPLFVNQNVTALAVDRLGSLWVATYDGLLRYRGGVFTRLSARDGLAHSKIFSVAASRQGGVWVGTEAGLSRVGEEGSIQSWPLNEARPVHNVAEDLEGRVWFYQGNRVGVLVPGAQDPQWVSDSVRSVLSIAAAPNGHVVVGLGRGLWVYEHPDRPPHIVGRQTGYSDFSAAALHIQPDGKVWIAGNEGILMLEEARIHRLPQQVFVDGRCLLLDREGNLWVGERSGGLVRIREKGITTYTRADGLLDADTWSILELPGGELLVGSDTGVNWWTQGRFSGWSPPKRSSIQCLALHPDGTAWVGSEEHFWSFREGQLRAFRLDNVPGKPKFITALQATRSGELWVGISTRLHRFDHGEFSTNYLAGVTNEGRIINLFEDRNGSLWVGTLRNGFWIWNGRTWRHLGQKEGLGSDTVAIAQEDADGTLWVISDNGIGRIRDERIQWVFPSQGLWDPLCYAMLEDAHGHFWASCHRGIFRMARSDLTRAMEDPSHRVRCIAYGVADGLPGMEANGGNSPAGCRTRDGHLWFTNTRGLVRVDPDKLLDLGVPPGITLERVVAGGVTLFGADAGMGNLREGVLPLPPGGGRVLEIHYSANTFIDPERAQYAYLLEGHQKEWHQAGNRRMAYFSDLKPGRYTFRVRAANHQGIWNEVGVALPLAIQPHLHEQVWFWPAVGACLLGLASGLHRYRLGMVRKVEALQKQIALDNERARIARDMHDDLGSALTQLVLLGRKARSQLKEPALAASSLLEVEQASHRLFHAMDQIVWATNPKHDSLEGFVTFLCRWAEEFFAASEVRCRYDLPAELPERLFASDRRHQLFLACKEVFSNILKHASAREVWVRVRCGEAFELEIENQGSSPDMKALVETRRSGNGIPNIRSRMEEMGGAFQLEFQPDGARARFVLPWSIFESPVPGSDRKRTL